MHKVFKILSFLLLIISIDGYAQQYNLQNFSITDGLESNTINDITQDEIGYLWLATDKGYTKFDGVKFTNYKQEKANCIFIQNNTIYIGLKNGLLVIQENKISFFENKEILKIKSINNKIILATIEGVSELKEDYIQPLQINTKIDFSIINDIIDSQNSIYIASNNGLWRLDKLYKTKSVKQISDKNCNSFLINNNKLITSFTDKNIKIIDKNKFINTIETLENISSIKKVQDEIWILTNNNGIEVLNAENYTFKRKINKYNTEISNQINTVFKDNQNSIWVGSANKGLYKYAIKNSTTKAKNLKVYIESLSVNYNQIPISNSNKLEFTPSENNIAISYKTVNLNQSKETKYRYKLNTNYAPWSSKNSVEFANLKSGKYQFSVQSKNGTKLSNEASILFTIDQPIYLKIWFLILLISFIFLLIALFIDIRLKQIKKKSKIEVDQLKLENHLLSLEQKALQLQMNPHFIFNVLNGIKALGNSDNKSELNKTISNFSILLRSILNNSRLEEISLKEEIITLGTYLQLEQQMSSNKFKFNISTSLKNTNTDEILIPPMLMQPFVENAVKHGIQKISDEGNISIHFEVKNTFLECSVVDNGVGFHHSKKENNDTHQSVALSVTKERIENLTKYHSFKIEEIIENKDILGTKISFKIPLKTDY